MRKLLRSVTKKLKEFAKVKVPAKKIVKPKPVPKHKIETVTLEEVEINVSWWTVVKILLVITIFMASIEILVQLRSLLIMTLLSFFLAMGLTPVLNNLENRKIPRPIAILILYVIFLGGLTILFVKVLPIIAEQILGIATDLRYLVANGIDVGWVSDLIGIDLNTEELQMVISQNLTELARNIQSVAGSTFSLITGIFQGLFNFIFTLVLLFFILLEREHIGKFFLLLFPQKDQIYIIKKANSIQHKLAEWFRGQFTLMLIVGGAMYIGMKIFEFIFGMKYAATIALFAGFMELFPYVGAMMSTILASLIAINISTSALIAVLIWMLTVQFFEGNFLIPIVMHKAVGLSSVVILLVLSIGATLGYAAGGFSLSILGMIFAVPISASVAIFIQEYTNKHNHTK